MSQTKVLIFALLGIAACVAFFALTQERSGSTPGAETKSLAQRVRARAEELGFDAEVVDKDHVLIRGTSIGEARLFLGNIADELRFAKTELEKADVIDRRLLSLRENGKRRLVVIVRSAEYVRALAVAKLNPRQIKHIAGDLYGILAWDEGDRIGTTRISDAQLGENPIAKGLRGVEALSEEIEMSGEDLKMITCGGDFEASLLLDDIWDHVAEQVDGDVIAAVPARDVLLVTGANNAEGLRKMEGLIRHLHDEGVPYPVSRTMLRRKDGGWVVERVVK